MKCRPFGVQTKEKYGIKPFYICQWFKVLQCCKIKKIEMRCILNITVIAVKMMITKIAQIANHRRRSFVCDEIIANMELYVVRVNLIKKSTQFSRTIKIQIDTNYIFDQGIKIIFNIKESPASNFVAIPTGALWLTKLKKTGSALWPL